MLGVLAWKHVGTIRPVQDLLASLLLHPADHLNTCCARAGPLCMLLQEQLLQREHKKEGKRARKRERELMVQAGLRPAPGQDSAAAAADAEEEDEGIVAGRIISYCALDYPRILDSVRWRLAMMKKNWQVCGCCCGWVLQRNAVRVV
jgi:hypothetical protein